MRVLTKVIIKLILVTIATFLFSSCTSNDKETEAEQIFKKVSGTVVVILAYDYNDELSKQGSGVVINDKGYVVTNYHVLEGCERIEILHNDEIVSQVDIIGIDNEKDILILKIEEEKFPAIKIGDSKALKIGQRIYAIGSPLGFENTISEGLISGLRSVEESEKNFIQITASISSGSSGGAVVNDKGELIGISTLTVKEGQNLNFAIPIDDVLDVGINSYIKDDTYKDYELFHKGLNAGKKENYQEAIEYFSSFIMKYPNFAVAYFNRGVAKNQLKDYRGAVQDYTKSIEIEPDYADSYYNRGVVKYYGLKDFKGAIQDYTISIEIEPYDAMVYVDRGNAKSTLQDYREAIQDYTKAIEIEPDYVDAYIKRGGVKSDLGDYRGAIQDYTKSIEIKPDYAVAYFARGIAKSYLKDYRGAIQDYTKLIEIEPNNSDAYFNRAATKYDLGDKYGACLDWSRAGELGEDFAYTQIRNFCQ